MYMQRKRKGFTLLEVLIVVIIIGVLAAIALPQYTNTIEKAKSAEATSTIGALRSSMERYWYDQGSFGTSYTRATDLDDLDIDNPNDDTGARYEYSLTDLSDISVKTYTIDAKRDGLNDVYWVKWEQTTNQDGKLYRSDALGGPSS